MNTPPFQFSERYSFETPEQIDVAYTVAGLGSRFMAALLDTVIISLVTLILMLPGTFGVYYLVKVILSLLGHAGGDELIVWVLAGSSLLSFLVIAGYYVLFEAFWRGQTPGKRRMGIRVIREGGYPLNFTTSMIRNLIRLIDFLPSYYIVGVVVVFIDPKSRRLGDLAAGTLVIKEHKDVKLETLDADLRFPTIPELSIDDQSRLPIRDARRLGADDRRLLLEFLRRRPSLPVETSSRIAGSLARAFSLRLHHDLADESAEHFLARLARALDESGE